MKTTMLLGWFALLLSFVLCLSSVAAACHPVIDGVTYNLDALQQPVLIAPNFHLSLCSVTTACTLRSSSQGTNPMICEDNGANAGVTVSSYSTTQYGGSPTWSFLNGTQSAGLTFRSFNGDAYNCAGQSSRSTRIDLICDPNVSIGTPVLVSNINCVYTFQWRTMYACPNQPPVGCTSGPAARNIDLSRLTARSNGTDLFGLDYSKTYEYVWSPCDAVSDAYCHRYAGANANICRLSVPPLSGLAISRVGPSVASAMEWTTFNGSFSGFYGIVGSLIRPNGDGCGIYRLPPQVNVFIQCATQQSPFFEVDDSNASPSARRCSYDFIMYSPVVC